MGLLADGGDKTHGIGIASAVGDRDLVSCSAQGKSSSFLKGVIGDDFVADRAASCKKKGGCDQERFVHDEVPC